MVNLALDCISVFVFGMGIKGAALSTTIAQWAGLLYLVHQVRFVAPVGVVLFRRDVVTGTDCVHPLALPLCSFPPPPLPCSSEGTTLC